VYAALLQDAGARYSLDVEVVENVSDPTTAISDVICRSVGVSFISCDVLTWMLRTSSHIFTMPVRVHVLCHAWCCVLLALTRSVWSCLREGGDCSAAKLEIYCDC